MGAESATVTRTAARQAQTPARQSVRVSAPPQRSDPQRELASPGGTAVPKSFAGIPPLAPGEDNRTLSFSHQFSHPLSHHGPRLPLQRKLAIGFVNDPLEAEADSIAERIMRGAAAPSATHSSSPVLRRKCACESCSACEEEKKKEEGKSKLMRKAQGTLTSVQAPPIVEDVLSSPGQPLDSETCAFMESRFDYDFSHVRLHTDERAQESARAIRALAYTVGSDVVFDRNHYSPGSPEGRRLLAHELTHVVQQSGPNGATSAAASGVIRRAQSKELGQIESWLSYGIFDWVITKDEANKALNLLKTLPKDQQAVFFAGKKYSRRLKENLPAARLPELSALELSVADLTPPKSEIGKIESNLSYGLFDWVITDAEAIDSLERLKKLPAEQLPAALAAIRYDRLMDNLPDARKPELVELRKLADVVSVSAVQPKMAGRQTAAQVLGPPAPGMTLAEFRAYTQQQADWFVEPSLLAADRDALWALLLHAEEGPHILTGIGDVPVSKLRGVAAADWPPLIRFCAGTHSSGHTIRIFPPLPALDERIKLGKTLTKVEASILPAVLEITASQSQLQEVQTKGLAPKLTDYWTKYHPHLEQTFSPAIGARGPEFERILKFLDGLGGLGPSGLAALDPLRGATEDQRWVRNLHRFPLPMLKKLVSNLGNKSGTKRLVLVLHTGHDAPGAFQEAEKLFNDLVLSSPNNLVLMIEGATSLAAITGRIDNIAATWGQKVAGKRVITQVVIAGHGSSQTVGMAGTSAPTVSDGNVKYAEESMVSGTPQTDALLQALLHHMPAATAHVLYAGCLVGSTPVAEGTPAAAIPAALAANESLAAHTKTLAAGEGIPAGRVEAARASVGLASVTTLSDPGTGVLKTKYPFDPKAFGSATDYAKSGREPEGVLRAAVEVGAANKITAETLLRTRMTMAATGDWYDTTTRILVPLALPAVVGAGVDLERVNELANVAEVPFLAFWEQFDWINAKAFKDRLNPKVFAPNVYNGIAATNFYTAPVANHAERMRVIVDQGWLALSGAPRAAALLAGILETNRFANVLELYLNKDILKPEKATLLPLGLPPTQAQIRLALAWLDLDNGEAQVRSFLSAQVQHPPNAPPVFNAAVSPEISHAGRTDRDVLDVLGFSPRAIAAPAGGGGPGLPIANVGLPDSPGTNRILVTGSPHLAHVSVATALVRREPAALRPPIAVLHSGDEVRVSGSVGDWRAVDVNGKLGFIKKTEITPP